MSKLVCVKCNQFFHPLKNGVTVEEGRPASSADKRGEGNWLPYKLWQADLVECRGCGTQVITGFGFQPISEHYMSGYNDAKRQRLPLAAFIKDCP